MAGQTDDCNGDCKFTGHACMYDCPNGDCWGDLPTGTRRTINGLVWEWNADTSTWANDKGEPWKVPGVEPQ